MHRIIFLSILLLGVIRLWSQDSNPCDSVSIDCCLFDLDSDLLIITVSNTSNTLFHYPGFILFNNTGDTAAIETVNYYGIGPYNQEHFLELLNPIDLPFEGYLELHIDFYAIYACTFPLLIDDTLSTGISKNLKEQVAVFPNPAGPEINIRLTRSIKQQVDHFTILNSAGQQVFTRSNPEEYMNIKRSELGQGGIYLILFYDQKGKLIDNKKLILN
jgi:hypothetical protein